MKTVLVTGSNRGLGKELALEFSKNYNVIIHGRDLESLKNVYDKLPKCRRSMVRGDIRDKKTLDCLEVMAKGGRFNEGNLDILVNNAGIYSGNLKDVMDVNFFAPIDLTERVLPIFKSKKNGLIVNINSIAGKQGSKGECAYSASKHALKGYFDSLRYDVTKHGIRILNVYLGGMNTQMTKGRENQELLMNPQEVARVIVKNCELYSSLNINEISIGRINY